MRAWLLVCLAALAVGCDSDTPHGDPPISTVARVEFQDVEGGVWLLRSEQDGTLYHPSDLPDMFKVVGARAQVTMIRLRDRVSAGFPGVPVRLLAIGEATSCGHTCGAPYPPLTLHIVDDRTSNAVEGVILENLIVPVPPPGGEDWGDLLVGCSPSPAHAAHPRTTCTVHAGAPGTYEFDVTAPGYEPQHMEVEVPAYSHVPGACCEPPWIAQTVDVRLVPTS